MFRRTLILGSVFFVRPIPCVESSESLFSHVLCAWVCVLTAALQCAVSDCDNAVIVEEESGVPPVR